MSSNLSAKISQWLHRLRPKDERNFISAAFHMITISLISMSMVDLTWFNVSGGVCLSPLSLGRFFTFGYSDVDIPNEDLRCITPLIVNMIRITILLCFMAIIFSLGGFFLDILGPKSTMYRLIRRYSLLDICTVLWILAIISVSYYVVLLLGVALENNKLDGTVTFGPGFFILVSAGGICLFGIFYNLILVQPPTGYSSRDDDRCLIDNTEDGMETFNSPTPPPPYSVPPPPYTP